MNRDIQGIVTKFTMSTIPNTCWSEVRVFHSAENEKLLEALARFSDDAERDPQGSFLFYSAAEAIPLILFHTGDLEERPAVFDAFEGINFPCNLIAPR